jgi:hypothetical protein
VGAKTNNPTNVLISSTYIQKTSYLTQAEMTPTMGVIFEKAESHFVASCMVANP